MTFMEGKRRVLRRFADSIKNGIRETVRDSWLDGDVRESVLEIGNLLKSGRRPFGRDKNKKSDAIGNE